MINWQIISISATVILMLLGLLRLNNNKRLKRYLQVPFIFIAPIFVIAEVVALEITQNTIIAWLNGIPFLGTIYTFLTNVTGLVYGCLVLVLNFLLVIPWLLIKLILRPIFNKILGKKTKHILIDRWYTLYDESIWVLSDRYTMLRNTLRALSWTLVFVTAAICALSWIVKPASDYWLVCYPSAALIIVYEIYCFFNGFNRTEYNMEIGGDDIRSTTRSQYNKLRQIYETMFPEALLSSRTGKDFSTRNNAAQLLHKMASSEDETERVVSEYFQHLGYKKPVDLDIDLVNASNKLMHHESTIIFNPFYHDLSDYIMLPIVDTLLNGKKVLVIVGRQSLRDNISKWIDKQLFNFCRTGCLWSIKDLADADYEREVGLLSFADLYDLNVINRSSKFLHDVGFVLLIEPSRMLTTSQTGLSIVAGKFNQNEAPFFCACDRESDGLVDLLSHVFHQSITNVIAAPPIQPTYTAMGWDASGDYKRQNLFKQQTHFLGNGAELAAVALKHQVPRVDWYSEEKAPVNDIQWIVGQSYPQFARFTGLPYQQKSIEDHIHFSSDLWDRSITDDAFIIAEDEACNMFATLRAYLTRGRKQSFVHVFSESYLLRDYMRYNWQLFMTDAKAIPTFSPLYAKTERNVVIRLIILMASKPVQEKIVAQELQLLGYNTENGVYQIVSKLITDYTGIEDTIIKARVREDRKNALPVQTIYYSIDRSQFVESFANSLKNASFVIEDEELGQQYIDARMFGHITQIVMPGQQVIYDGKMYRVHKVSPEVGCVLHRASDQYMERLYYRQLRTYELDKEKEVITSRKVGDLEITVEKCSFTVNSTGYLEMKNQHDLRTARFVDFSDDPDIGTNETYVRKYTNKSVMSIRLLGTDEETRYTISLLLSEMLHTLYPYSWHYLAILSKKPTDSEGMLDKYSYNLTGAFDDDLIYVLEDSDMDLGLLESIDQNLFRIFEILADYLNWHIEKINEPPQRDPVTISPAFPDKKKEKKRPVFGNILSWIGDLFTPNQKTEEEKDKDQNKDKDKEKGKQPPKDKKKKRKGGKGETAETPVNEAPSGQNGDSGEEKPVPFEDAPQANENPENVIHTVEEITSAAAEPVTGLQSDDRGGTKQVLSALDPDDDQDPYTDSLEVISDERENDFLGYDGIDDELDIQLPIEPSRYEKGCYLKFGFDEIDPCLAIESTRIFLNSHGFGVSSLHKARICTGEMGVKLDMSAEFQCDFCGVPLNGVSFEQLSDGRIRCHNCSASAINDVDEFRDVFNSTLTLLEENYHIGFKHSISVKITDAVTIGKLSNHVFKPTAGYDGRVVGFAVHDGKEAYLLYIENGSPRLATIATTAHELTHIWQYLNWNSRKVKALYKKKKIRDIVYEGMATWVEIQTLYMIGEFTYAQEQEQIMENRAQNPDDVYGIGFLMYREKYGMNRQGEIPTSTPFNVFPPL